MHPQTPTPEPVRKAPQIWEIPGDFRSAVAAFEQRVLRRALERAQFKQTTAAKLLGLSYHQLRSLLRKHALAKSANGDADLE